VTSHKAENGVGRQRDHGSRKVSCEVDGCGSGLCLIACFGISAVEPLGSITLYLTSY
jgi:hypothetical protein